MNNNKYKGFIQLFFVIYILIHPVIIVLLGIPLDMGLLYCFGGLGILGTSVWVAKKFGIFNTQNFALLIFGFSVLYSFSLADYHCSVVTKGTQDKPYLMESDADLYHTLGMFMAGKGGINAINFTENGKVAIGKRTINNVGYPALLSLGYRLVPDLSIGMLLNILSTMITFVLIAKIAHLIIPDDKYVYYCLFLAVISPQILASGVVLLKDSLIVLGVASVLQFFLTDKKKLISIAFFILGLIIIFSFRTALIMFIVLFGLIKMNFTIKRLTYFGVGLVFLFFLMTFSSSVSSFQFNAEYISSKIFNNTTRNEWDMEASAGGFVILLAGQYNSLFVGLKLILLPIPAIIQYLLPFDFWNTTIVYPWQILQKNANIIWFLYTGPIMLSGYFLFYRQFNRTLFRVATIGALGYLLMAFLNSGAIPRYYYPFLPMLIPVGGYALYESKRRIVSKNKYKTFMFFYYVVASFLAVAYIGKSLL